MKPQAQPEQIVAALNQFYANEPACLWQQMTTLDATRLAPTGPIHLSDPNASRAMTAVEAKALVGAGLIVSAGERFALTAEGRKAWRIKPEDPT